MNLLILFVMQVERGILPYVLSLTADIISVRHMLGSEATTLWTTSEPELQRPGQGQDPRTYEPLGIETVAGDWSLGYEEREIGR